MKLTDTQLIILADAMKRDDGAVIISDRLKGGAATEAIDRLLEAKLIEEVSASGTLPSWRRDDEEGRTYALCITEAGLRAIHADEVDMNGLSSPLAPKVHANFCRTKSAAARSTKHVARTSPTDRSAKGKSSPPRPKRGPGKKIAPSKASRKTAPRDDLRDHVAARTAPREGSKIASIIVLLRRAKGASIEEIMPATGWLPHTTRAALTGLRKRGLVVERAKEPRGKTTVTIYRIVGA